MLKNKKGFTLVELTAVIILLVVIITMATLNYMSSYNNGKISSFVDEAFVISEGAINKYSDDRLVKKYSGDVFLSKNNAKRCYPIKPLLGRYVSKGDENYHGSVEICTATNCSYKTKIWLSDGVNYLNGVIVDDTLSTDDVTESKDTEYFDSCGVDVVSVDSTWFYDYVGFEETFIAPFDGVYSIESWGASGGNAFYIVRDAFGFGSSPRYIEGGKGGYAYVEISLKKGDVLYINVGGHGDYNTYDRNIIAEGGYNGGGKANYHSGGGGGATHVALKSGPIYTLSTLDIIEVAGGGGAGYGDGGEYFQGSSGRNGGGRCDSSNGACFASDGSYGKVDGLGAGGGLYTSNGGPLVYDFHSYTWGGVTYYFAEISALRASANGGSGYIGNPLTRNGVMYVLNGYGSDDPITKTISTANYSSDPISTYAKDGDGFVKITSIGDFTN